MEHEVGSKIQVVSHDSQGGRLDNWVCDFPGSPKRRRCRNPTSTLGNIMSGTSRKSCMILCLTFLLLSFVILHICTPNPFATKIGRGWRHVMGFDLQSNFDSPGYVPPYVLNSSYCPELCESSKEANSVPLSSNTTSPVTHHEYYDVCLSVSIGDDGDQPNDEAIPYPLVSRLTDALAEEALSSRKDSSTKETSKVLVGVDYGSLVCLIVRDTFAELPGVKAECKTFSELEQGTKCGKLVVGCSKRFVPQVPKAWSEAVEWQTRRQVDLDCLDSSHQPPALSEEDWQPTVVTGFSSNHMSVGLLLLRSIGKAVKDGGHNGQINVSVVVWAMEVFDPVHQGYLDCVIDELIHEYGVKAEVRFFDWSAYPSWMRINQTLGYFGGTGEYAWKAVMVHTILRERGIVLWADAGDRFRRAQSLFETLKGLKAKGFVSQNSDGKVDTRTHPLLLKYYRANIPEIRKMRNCEAAILGFTLKTYTEFARPWYDCSVTRQCIAPDGSDRSNHRQDQSALTVLGILSKHPCGKDFDAHPYFTAHMEHAGVDVRGTNPTKCYKDPLVLGDKAGTFLPPERPRGIIDEGR